MNAKTLTIASAFVAFMMVAGPVSAQTPPADAGAPAATAPAPDAAAPAAPADAAPGTPANVTAQSVTNPYGLEALVKTGDFVSHGVLILLLIMSFGTWYIFVTKFVEQAKLLGQAKTTERQFWTAANLEEGIDKLGKNNVFRNVAERGQQAMARQGGMLSQADWVQMSLARAVEEENARLGGGISFLASVGSTAPFVGLFGTVWGILNALTAIGVAGQASIDKVAGPVGEALIMTALGLAVAVPAVLCYNFLVRRNKVLSEKFRSFANDLQTYLLSSKR
ncbi:MAG TPA: MotA/TolQ/ExbB proton channel family protein [Micropepsaceae bacterium]|jgi:biopolymer transport protein ExbB|nr:MotA/TolQ/ExbB proton channel family protein [Micropepsaceae bacterium]